MRFSFLSFALCVASVSFGAVECSRLSVDVSALPERYRLVGDLLRERVEVRTPRSDAAGTLSVAYAIDPSVPGENAKVTVEGSAAKVRAGRFRGLVFGTGCLLKSLRYGARTFEPVEGNREFAPARELRMAYFARHLLNWYMESSADELCRYIDDLALDGINAFLFQYSIPEVDAERESPESVRRFESVSRAMADRIAELDCDFCEWGGSNQLKTGSPERFRGIPNTDPKRGNLGFNACPEIPGALDAMIALRKDNLSRLEGVRVGYLCHWSFDEGGCECRTCFPWGGDGATALPNRLSALFRQSAAVSSGFAYYSEGNYEDINKAIVTGLNVDPSADADGILRRYGAYHFAGADPEDFVRLAHVFEMNHRIERQSAELAAAAKAISEKMDGAILPGLRTAWRWRLVWLRAHIDHEIASAGDKWTRSAFPYYDELTKIYHSERQLREKAAGRHGGYTAPRYGQK